MMAILVLCALIFMLLIINEIENDFKRHENFIKEIENDFKIQIGS